MRPFTHCNFTYRLHAYIFSCLVLSSVDLQLSLHQVHSYWNHSFGSMTGSRGNLGTRLSFGFGQQVLHDLSYKLPVTFWYNLETVGAATLCMANGIITRVQVKTLLTSGYEPLFIDCKVIGPTTEPVIYFPLFLGALQGVHSTWEKVWWQRRDRRCDSQ